MCDAHTLLIPAPIAYPRRVWGILTGPHNLARYAWTLARATARPLLDVGCSWGYESVLLARAAPGIVALDADPAAVQATAAIARANSVPLDATPGDIYALPFPDGAFPCVCCSEVLEHLERPAEAMRELVRVCGGRLIVTVPAHGAMRNTVGHIQDFAPGDLRAMAEAAGAHVTEQTTAHPFQMLVAERGTLTP